jgi:hypothetical protein
VLQNREKDPGSPMTQGAKTIVYVSQLRPSSTPLTSSHFDIAFQLL